MYLAVCQLPFVGWPTALATVTRWAYTRVSFNHYGVAKMATAKAPNYSPEQTAQIVEQYQAGISVDQIAQTMGRTVRSIVAKLSREKVYISKEYKTKNGEAAIKKDVHADFIGAALKLSENDIESLTKANKSALRAISDFIRNSAN